MIGESLIVFLVATSLCPNLLVFLGVEFFSLHTQKIPKLHPTPSFSFVTFREPLNQVFFTLQENGCHNANALWKS